MNDVAKQSRWEDYMEIFTSPSAVFQRRADGKFGHAIVVFVVLAVVLYYATISAMQPIMEAEFMRGAQASQGQTTPEQMEAVQRMTGLLGGGFVLIGTPITFFLLGAAVWLGAKVAGGSVTYPQGTVIATLGMFPRLVESPVSALQALFLDQAQLTSRYAVSLGLGRFLDPDGANAVILGLLGRVDLFTLWVTALIGIGIKVIARVPSGQAAAGAAVVWLIGALPAIVQGFVRG